MALTSKAEIQDRIRESAEELKDSAYPEDVITGLADSETPLMYSDILAEWLELDNDSTDRWQELGYNGQERIYDLMQVDIYLYYQDQFSQAWELLKEEIAGEE